MIDARAELTMKSADGATTIGKVRFDAISLVRNVEEYDVISVTCNPEQDVFAGMNFDDYVDKRFYLERAGSYVDDLRSEGVYFIRAGEWTRNSVTFTAFGPEYLLASRIVAYPAGDTNSQMTDQADDMMKRVVETNLGASSTDTTRTIAGITDAADQSLGETLDRAFAHYNVLSVLDGIREASRDGGTEILYRLNETATGFEFVTYSGCIGADRRGLGMNLSEVNENFLLEAVGFDATTEVTFMYTGGSGQRENRWIGTASDTARMGLSPYNRREAFYNCNQDDTQVAVDDAAAQELSTRRAKRIFSGEIKERKNYRYGVEWDFGDLLRAEHAGQTYDVMVRKVRIDIVPGGETISARVEVV